MSEKIETRSVELSELQSGIQLGAGHEVVLVVNGITGRPRRRKPGDDKRPELGADAPGTTPAGQSADAKDHKFHIHMQLHAAGGTPLAGEKVRIHDPDTGEQVGTATTDDAGVLQVSVPAEKDYHIFVDSEPAEEHANEFGDLLHPPRDADRHSILSILLLDASRAPLKGEKVSINGENGEADEAVTDDDGHIHVLVEHGVFNLQVRDKSFIAHSVFNDDPRAEGAAYKFVVC